MSDSVFQNSGCVNTILGAYNMLNGFCDVQYFANLETTLNSKYRRLQTQLPTSIPKLRYFGVGIKGYYNSGDNDHRKYNPDPRNMDLHSPMPIRMVPIENDLTPTERALYRMRVVETVGTQKYACYYLKKIDWDPSYVEIIQKGADGTETKYNLDPDFLLPTPTKAVTGGRMTTQDARVIVRVVGKCSVTLKELAEASSIKYNRDYCIVSEWGYYTGCEVYLTADEEFIGDASAGTERPGNAENLGAVYVQLAKHKTDLPLTLSSTESELTSWVSFESPEAVEI